MNCWLPSLVAGLACPLAHPLAAFIKDWKSFNYGVAGYGLEASQQANNPAIELIKKEKGRDKELSEWELDWSWAGMKTYNHLSRNLKSETLQWREQHNHSIQLHSIKSTQPN